MQMRKLGISWEYQEPLNEWKIEIQISYSCNKYISMCIKCNDYPITNKGSKLKYSLLSRYIATLVENYPFVLKNIQHNEGLVSMWIPIVMLHITPSVLF